MAESMIGLKRSHRCTEVSNANIGEEITVMGWVQKRRNLGSLIFIDLRDRSGILQIVFDENDVQKMEEYSGISILATNVMNNFDDAFKRRITFMIPIETLDEEGTLELWEKIFPKEAPLAADVDFERYARVAVMNGSNIKSAAIHAAYAAAAKNSEITDHDLVQAIDEEYRRLGHTSIISELEMG